MTLPNFLIIGAAKAGTTSLYYYLKQHPDVFMSPIKEPIFFAAESGEIEYPGPDGRALSRAANPGAVTTVEEYEALFAGVGNEKAVGEASPMYLYVPTAARRIQTHVPDAKLIAILRDPAERAYSAFLQRVREGREPAGSFREALGEEEARIRAGWGLGYHYKSRGFYYEQLRRYYETFGPEQIRVYLYEELGKNPVGVAQDIFRFLGVDDAFIPDTSARHNTAGVPRSAAARALVRRLKPVTLAVRPLLWHGVLRALRRRVFVDPPPMPEENRRELAGVYREDVEKLRGLIGRDLSGWLGGSAEGEG